METLAALLVLVVALGVMALSDLLAIYVEERRLGPQQ